jgi:long-chain acyl-CoA synthetase
VLLPLPLHHVYPFTVGMLVPLASGASIIFPRSLSGPQIVRAMTQGRASFLLGVPRIYSALTAAIEDRVAARGRVAAAFFRAALAFSTMLRRRTGLRIGRGLFAMLHRQMAPNLDTVVSGGAPIAPGLARKLEGLGWRFMNGYGLTETSPVLAFNEPGRARIGTVGRPLSGVEVRIAEPESERPHGEILARGPNVFSGYWNLPDKTDEVFTPDGFFRTGDLGEFDEDGCLRILGRASSLITHPGGENVRPEDVEEALGQPEVIDEAGVLLHEDKLVAVIVPERESIGRADGEELDTRIRQEVSRLSRRLPSHHRVSDLVISREPLVRTRLGKIRRHLLAQRYQEIRQGDDTARRPAGPVAIEEMSPEMQALFEIPVTRQTWDWLVERFPDARLTPETVLQSELGIDSLDWLRLGLEIQQRTGRQLNEEAMRRIDTVGDLLREITEAEQDVSTEAGDVVDRLRTPEDLIDENQRRWLRPRGFLTRAIGSALFGIDRLALRALLGLQVVGRENVEGDSPVLLVPNHRSYLDAPALAAALPKKRLRQTQWGGATSVMFRNWSRRLVSRATSVVPVEPQREPETSLALAAAVLQNDRSLVWFPEGAISRDGRLQPFQPGIALLIEAQAVPVVPVWIEGTQRALPFGSWRLRLVKITVRFGKRILPEDIPKGDRSEEGQADRIAQFLHDRVAELEPADA